MRPEDEAFRHTSMRPQDILVTGISAKKKKASGSMRSRWRGSWQVLRHVGCVYMLCPFSFFFFQGGNGQAGIDFFFALRWRRRGGGRAADMSSSLVRGMDMKGVVVYDDMRSSEYDLRRLEGLLLYQPRVTTGHPLGTILTRCVS
jgi:hypothetical protein